jgi:hypothetical protein
MQEGNIWCVDVPEKNTNYILHLTQEKFKGTFKEKFMPHSHGISKVNTRVNDPTSPPQSLHWPTVGWGCPSICFWRLPSHVHPSANFQTAFLAQTLEPCHKQITNHVRTLVRHNYKFISTQVLCNALWSEHCANTELTARTLSSERTAPVYASLGATNDP